MKLTRANLLIARQAATENSRCTLEAIYVTPNETVVTNGVSLTCVTTLQRSLPVKQRETFKPFLISPYAALVAAQSINTRKDATVMEATAEIGIKAAVDSTPDRVELTNTDRNGNETVRSSDAVEGRYPDWKRVIPSSDGGTRIFLDAKYLRDVCDHAISMQRQPRGPAVIELNCFNDDRSIRIDYTDGKQFATAVISGRTEPENGAISAQLATLETISEPTSR